MTTLFKLKAWLSLKTRLAINTLRRPITRLSRKALMHHIALATAKHARARFAQMSFICACFAEPAMGGVLLFSVGGNHYQLQVESMLSHRFARIEQQRYDYSCGSAAIATLLRYHYRRNVTSADVFKAMYAHGDKALINQYGFSMLDMKRYLARLGFRSEGLRLPLDRYVEIAGVPAIVMINSRGYKHFVVLKGIRDNKVLIGDPARGAKSFDRQVFNDIWTGLVFIITNEAKIGRAHFNRDSDWSALIESPATAARRKMDLGQFQLTLPTHKDFF